MAAIPAFPGVWPPEGLFRAHPSALGSGQESVEAKSPAQSWDGASHAEAISYGI